MLPEQGKHPIRKTIQKRLLFLGTFLGQHIAEFRKNTVSPVPFMRISQESSIAITAARGLLSSSAAVVAVSSSKASLAAASMG